MKPKMIQEVLEIVIRILAISPNLKVRSYPDFVMSRSHGKPVLTLRSVANYHT